MEIEFNLGKVPAKDGIKLCQLVTHAYEIIKDCEVQSYFDIGFGGYIHQVLFNTTIVIDRIYRVDVAYTLSSENKLWYQFWLNTKEEDVRKSLTAERKTGGFFNLFSYQGFQEGTFQSNIKTSKTYDYKMHLNYDETCWDLFDNPPYYEADYKIIKNFQILRINYLVADKVYDVAVKMDRVDGETLKIIDRNLIMDTGSTTWKVKDKIYEAVDTVKEKFGEAGTIVLALVSAFAGILFIYIVYKLLSFISKIFK